MMIAKLAAPLIVSRIGEMISSFLFLSFVGHALPSAQGHASFAWAFVSFATVTGIGFFSTLMIDVAGHRNRAEGDLGILLQAALKLAVILGAAIVLASCGYLLLMATPSEGMSTPRGKTLLLMSLSIPAIYLQIVIFNYLNALQKPKYELLFVWGFNLALLIATATCNLGELSITIEQFVTVFVALRWLLVVAALGLVRRTLARSAAADNDHPSAWQGYRSFIHRGIPLALCFGAESFLYFAFSLIASAQGDVALAGYQAALHFLSVIYMISIGVGNATAITVAPAALAGEMHVVRKRLLEGLAWGGLLLTPCLLVCLYLPSYVADLYTSDRATAVLITSHLAICAPFLVFEFIYVVARMTLRSLGDSWVPTIMTILCMNVLGLSLVAALFWVSSPDTQYLFWALTVSTLMLMALLTWRLARRLRASKGARPLLDGTGQQEYTASI